MKKLLFLLLLLLPATTHAAIARDSTAWAAGSSGASKTWAFTNTAGNVLVAFVWKQQTASASDTLTYNGVSMAYVGNANEGAGGAVQTYILGSPATGTNNFVFTLASGSVYIKPVAISYSGAATTGLPDGHNECNSDCFSSNITSTATGSWVVAVGVDRAGVPGNGTGVLTKISGDADIAESIYDSNGTVSTGSNAYGYSGATAAASYLIGVSIAPVASVTPASILAAILAWFDS